MAKKPHGWSPDKAAIQTLYAEGNAMEGKDKINCVLKLIASEENQADTYMIRRIWVSEDLSEKIDFKLSKDFEKELMTGTINDAIKDTIKTVADMQLELDGKLKVAKEARVAKEQKEAAAKEAAEKKAAEKKAAADKKAADKGKPANKPLPTATSSNVKPKPVQSGRA